MDKKAWSFFSVIAFAVFTIGAFSFVQAENTPQPNTIPDPSLLEGKVISLEIVATSAVLDNSDRATLKDARFMTIGNRLFIVGRGHTGIGPRNWYTGIEIGVSWESVRQFQTWGEKEYDQYYKEWLQEE